MAPAYRLRSWSDVPLSELRYTEQECQSCHKITLVPVNWSRPKSHFTLQFDAWAMRLMAETPVNAAARELREHDTRMWRILHHYVDKVMSELDVTTVKRIAVDETSSRRGHRYITLFVDVDTKIVLFATEGKGMDTLEKFKQHLDDKGVAPEQIQEVCCDMSPAFIRGIEEQFPNAEITYGYDVLALVGELRFKQHRTVKEIADALNERGIPTSERHAQNLYERYQMLLAASSKYEERYGNGIENAH